MKTIVSKFVALVLVALVLVTGCSSTPGTERLSGNYQQDAETVIVVLREAANTPADAANLAAVQEDARSLIDAFAARYSLNKYSNLQSYTTLRTVFNTLGSYYRKTPDRPIRTERLERVKSELDKAELALKRNR